MLDLKLLSIRHHPLLMNIFSIGRLHPLPSPHHCLTHSQHCILYIHHQSSVPGNPKMMSDLIPLFHSDLHPVILLLLQQFLRTQHTSTDSQQARTYDSFRLDGSMSPWHPHEAPQICHWVCPFIHTHQIWSKTESTWQHLGMPI